MATETLTSSDPTRSPSRSTSRRAQLKIVHAALRSMRDDFGHDQHDVHKIIHEVLAKLPDEASIRAIDIGTGR